MELLSVGSLLCITFVVDVEFLQLLIAVAGLAPNYFKVSFLKLRSSFSVHVSLTL